MGIVIMTGKKQKHSQKTKRFENGVELEPLDLKKRFADLGHRRRDFSLISKKEHQREQKAFELLNLVKSTTTKSQCFIFKTENLLLDFFHEKLEENEATARAGDFDQPQVLKLTEDWINGEAGEMKVMGWELPEGRNLYIKDMEMAGKWRSFAGEEGELAAEVEAEVWISLLNELLIEIS